MENSISVSPGFQRFNVQLNSLVPLLKFAGESTDPARNFFYSTARQHLFYLEALTRIYRKLHDKEIFNSLRQEFKALEDQLGKVDFYAAWVQEFSSQPDIPVAIPEYFRTRLEEACTTLTALLKEKKWIGDQDTMIQSITKQLQKVSWLNAEEDKRAIVSFLDDELDDFTDDYKEGKYNFTEIESGLHEFRRDLRWFSIYAMALNGLIQLKEARNVDPLFEKYMTDEIKNSPYNQLPPPGNSVTPIYIEAPHFYALSGMINESGLLKDAGLRIHALTEAAKVTGGEKKRAEGIAMSLIKNQQETLQEIPKKMKKLAEVFMSEEKVLKRIRKEIAPR
jgi:inorganic triphosphatase YgiF